jgi:hypothetical protein
MLAVFFMPCYMQDGCKWIRMNRKWFEVRLGCCTPKINQRLLIYILWFLRILVISTLFKFI